MDDFELKLKDIEEQLYKVDSSIIPLESFDETVRKLMAQVKAVEEARTRAKNTNWELRQQRIELERQANAVRAEQSMAERIRKQQEEFVAKQRAFDERTADCKWRLGIPGKDGKIKKIMDHQLYAAQFLSVAKRAICADEMGLGKTIESIATADGVGAKKILIITPGEVQSNFMREVQQWTNRAVTVIGRKPKAEVFKLLELLKVVGAKEFCLVINYEAWSRNRKLLSVLESMQFDMIICDEAHRIKEVTTSAYKGVNQLINSKNVCGNCEGVLINNICTSRGCNQTYADTSHKSVKYLLMLTGTPILNRPTELFPPLNLISPLHFPDLGQYLRIFCRNIAEWGQPPKYVFKEGGFEHLANKIQGFYLRRTLKDTGIVLPPQDVRIHEIPLDPEKYPLQAEILEQLRLYSQIMIDNNPAMDFISQLALITRQRQAATWPGGIKIKQQKRWPDGSLAWEFDGVTPVMEDNHIGDHFRESAKLDRAMEMLKEYIAEGKRVAIFTQFAEVIKELLYRCELDGVRAAGYFGATPYDVRDEIKADFDRETAPENYKWDVVIAHYKTGGEGVNFTAATRMIFTDQEWNPGKEDQAKMRINRIGQTEDTIVDILVLDDHIDAWMRELIDSKRDMIDNFNENNEMYAELRQLLVKKPTGDK